MDLPIPRHPPVIELPDGFRWALTTAFAIDRPPPIPPVPLSRMDPWLRRSGLWPPIAARLAPAEREQPRDPQGAALAREQRVLHAQSALRALFTAGLVADTARRMGIPVVFLKGAALHLADLVPPCGRPLADVDLLAPSWGAVPLHTALQSLGFVRLGRSLSLHHLDPLGHDAGLPLEIHRSLPGCSAPESPTRSIHFEDLLTSGRTTEVLLGTRRILLPAREILAAHCIVHGLVDHGLRPDRYPPWRWLQDLLVLGGDEPSCPFQQWISPPLRGTWCPSTQDLLAHLRRLSPDQDPLPASPAGRRLFRHLVAATLDPQYRLALRARQWFLPPGGPGLREGLTKVAAAMRSRSPSEDPFDPPLVIPAAMSALIRVYFPTWSWLESRR